MRPAPPLVGHRCPRHSAPRGRGPALPLAERLSPVAEDLPGRRKTSCPSGVPLEFGEPRGWRWRSFLGEEPVDPEARRCVGFARALGTMRWACAGRAVRSLTAPRPRCCSRLVFTASSVHGLDFPSGSPLPVPTVRVGATVSQLQGQA